MKLYKIVNSNTFPIVCNIPHSSIKIPTSFRKDFKIFDDKLSKEAHELADLFTDKLFNALFKTYNYNGIISLTSRLATDIERFEDDKLELMSKVGMGVLYTKSQSGKTIRELSHERREYLLNLFYRPYHNELTDLVTDSLKKFKKCIILDCHSFPSTPRSYEPDQENNRPDICIGVDKYHTSKKLVVLFEKEFKKNNFSVSINSPFSGTIIPTKYYKKEKNVLSVMIEINRKLYMNEKKFLKNKDFSKISKIICLCVNNSIQRYLKNRPV
ncbi:MAG: N-formylglutamate amidohydrolase [Candidatus Falkowbacteria bacterium]|nr:N-formylglutamate amidohydrolase [Candidatus Falkowbacteria bacterium]